MREKTKPIGIEDSFGKFEEFKKKFALDEIDDANLVFLYKVLIVEKYSSKKFNFIQYNPDINVNKLHTNLHNVLSESYIESYKSRNKIERDNKDVRKSVKAELRSFACLPYYNFFVCFTKYVIDRLKQRFDEIKILKDEVVKNQAMKELDYMLWLFSYGSEGFSQVIKEGELFGRKAKENYDDFKGTWMENFYKPILLKCVARNQYCDYLVQLISQIKKDLHGAKKDNNICILSNGIKQQALKIIKEIYHIKDKEAEKRYHNGLVKLWGGKFNKGMGKFLQKQIQTNLKNEKPEDKTEQQEIKAEENKETNKEKEKKEQTQNESEQKAEFFKSSYLYPILCNCLKEPKKVVKYNNDRKLSQKRLYKNEDTNQHRQERLKEIEERKKDSFNIDQNGKIIIETKKISKKQEEEMIKRLSKPKEKHIQANTKNSGRKLKKDEQKDLIDRLYYQPMGKYYKSGKTLTNLHNNKTFITGLT